MENTTKIEDAGILTGCDSDVQRTLGLITAAAKLAGKSEQRLCQWLLNDFYYMDKLTRGRTTLRKLKHAHRKLSSYIEQQKAASK